MTHLAVELIARSEERLMADVAYVQQHFRIADTINIPDLPRMPLRSWTACGIIAPTGLRTVPHVRAIDIAPDAPLPGADMESITQVLVIQGDPPADMSRATYPNSSEKIIRRYRKEAPHIKVYAAFDPYRRGMADELDAIARKEDAGAQGFFTQPLFDLRMLELCMEWLAGRDVYWGFSPVTSAASRSYWETTNRVIFSKDFGLGLDDNLAFTRKAMSMVRNEGGNIYLMPVKVSLQKYLGGLL